MLKTTLKDDIICIGASFSVSFQRTLRIPEDNQIYLLPPGLGTFPVLNAMDYVRQIPDSWKKPDHFFIPMYQREALWLKFEEANWKPNAVKIGVGQINALTGESWNESLHDNPQDYLISPRQPWLDGINVGEEFIRQFIAVPLREGYTIESQMTGTDEFGGIQILVYEPKFGIFPEHPPHSLELNYETPEVFPEMGLGAGGKIKQKIYPDPHGIDTWEQKNYGSAFIHIVNSEYYKELTGSCPPPTPISTQTYIEYGFPWFDLYDENEGDLPASQRLASIKTVREQE